MRLPTVGLIGGAVVFGMLAGRYVSRRRRRKPAGAAAERRAVGWGVAEEMSQAVSNAAPHEGFGLITPAPGGEG